MKRDSFIKEIFIPLLQTLDSILDVETSDKVCRHFSGFVPACNDETLCVLLAQDLEGNFGQTLINHIINGMDDERFKSVLSGIKAMFDIAVFQNVDTPSDAASLERAYQNMINSSKGKKLVRSKKEMIDTLKAGLSSLLKGDPEAFRDKPLMQSLPDGVEQLLVKGKIKTAETIIERLSEGLASEEMNIRDLVSEALSNIGDALFSNDALDIMVKLSYKFIDWINFETALTPFHLRICTQLQRLAQILIRKNRFSECKHILEAFNSIHRGQIQKAEPIRTLAGKMIKGIGTDDILDQLLKEFQTDEENKRKEAARNLIQLGSAVAERLIHMLKESQSRYDRTRILQLISDIGDAAIPAIIEELKVAEPWYYIRNLVLLLGKVGNRNHLPVLQPLFYYGDLRVQREVLNSVYTIAGKDCEKMILLVLPSVDDRLKIDIVSMISEWESHNAISVLLNLLKVGMNSASSTKNDLAEKICAALGKIGTDHAIPILLDIIGQHQEDSSTRTSYDENVKAAAAAALAQIRAKRGEASAITDSEKKVISHQEQFIGKYLARWDNDDTVEEYAVNLMLDLIIKYAREKDFSKAEFYKEKLIQLDAAAVDEIRIADEIISIEKTEYNGVPQEQIPKRPSDKPKENGMDKNEDMDMGKEKDKNRDSFLVTRW